jgi:hypothetical protein
MYALTSFSAVIVADRACLSISAISPKFEPGPSVATGLPRTETATSPLSITKKLRPLSPSPASVSPERYERSKNSPARRSSSASSKPAKSGTFRSSSLDGRAIPRDSMPVAQAGATPGAASPSRAPITSSAAATLGGLLVTAARNASRPSA